MIVPRAEEDETPPAGKKQEHYTIDRLGEDGRRKRNRSTIFMERASEGHGQVRPTFS